MEFLKAVSGMGFATHKLAEWPASKKYFERRDSCRRPSLSRTISASHNGARMQKKKKKGKHTNNDFPPADRRVWIVCVRIVLLASFLGCGAVCALDGGASAVW